MYQIYKVENSDTLDGIANKFGITAQKLREINGLTELYPGGYILVPSNQSMNNSLPQNNYSDTDVPFYMTYIVKQGDNVYAIAKEYGIPYETLLRLNGLNKNDYIYPGQQLMIPRRNSGVYITTETDTLNSFYNKYKNNWESFLAQNQSIYIVPDQMISYQ